MHLLLSGCDELGGRCLRTRTPQDEEWAGTCTLFIRDVVLSEKVLEAFKSQEEAEKGPISFPTRKAVVPSRVGGDQYVPKP